MEDIAIYAIVAAAFLFLGRWFYTNIVTSKPPEDTACGSCPTCEQSNDRPGSTGQTPTH